MERKIKVSYGDFQRIYSDDVLDQVLMSSAQTGRRRYCWHVAMPKSGSTWLSAIVGKMYQRRGGVISHLVPDHATRPQEIDPRYFITAARQQVFFAQQHCVWSRYTERLIDLTQTKIIFQYRDLLDVLMSHRDHIDDALYGSEVEKHAVPHGIHKLDSQQILDYVIDVELPWYCRFLDGWMSSGLAGKPNIFHVVRYEDLVDSPIATLQEMVSALSLEFKVEEIEAAYIEAGQGFTRKNKGVVGRGRATFTKSQLNRIKRTARYFNLASDYIKV